MDAYKYEPISPVLQRKVQVPDQVTEQDAPSLTAPSLAIPKPPLAANMEHPPHSQLSASHLENYMDLDAAYEELLDCAPTVGVHGADHVSPAVSLGTTLDTSDLRMEDANMVTPPPSQDVVAIYLSSPATITSLSAHNVTAMEELDLPVAAARMPTPQSERTPSPHDFGDFPKAAIDMHYERARISTETQGMMHFQSDRVLVTSSRGYGRARILPSRQTQPPLYSRRYSVDVNTKNWDCFGKEGWHYDDWPMTKYESLRNNQAHQFEPIPTVGSAMRIPFPARYPNLGKAHAMAPLYNDDIYLELGDATIRNDEFIFIGVTDARYGDEVWMRAESLGMALEVLRRDLDCDNYSIGIANSSCAQIFNFAYICNDADTNTYNAYRDRFRYKRWIFIVINDALDGTRNNSNDGIQGAHWSFAAIDMMARQVHYYDSFVWKESRSESVARDVVAGFLAILGCTEDDWNFGFERNSPDQYKHNQSVDNGACGPFVYKMMNILINKIKHYQDNGREEHCWLHLDNNFPHNFQNIFSSQDVRREIQRSIARHKAYKDASAYSDWHNSLAIQGADVVLLNQPVSTMDMELPLIPRKSSRKRQHSQSGSSSDLESQGRSSRSFTEMKDKGGLPHNNENEQSDASSSSPTAISIRLSSPNPYMDIDTSAETGVRDEQDGGISLIRDFSGPNETEDDGPWSSRYASHHTNGDYRSLRAQTPFRCVESDWIIHGSNDMNGVNELDRPDEPDGIDEVV